MTPSGRVLITGGSGSLGTHLLMTAQREHWDAELTVYSRDEVKQAALRQRFPDVSYVLGTVADRDALVRATRGIDLIIHAAAYKRVPEAERQTEACVQSNVIGSLNVATAAMQSRVPMVVGVSTDKACAPINAYGQSKALMERLFQAFARTSETRFHLVRYGNVLASRGSVIPLLQQQAAKGGPITLTDPDMTRFWLTLDDAVSLISDSLDIDSGEVLIPACRSASMLDVATAIGPEVSVEVIGTRGGERVHERLIAEEEAPYCRRLGSGWGLCSMSLPVRDELPHKWSYTSEHAERIPVPELRRVLTLIERDEEVRTL